MRYAVIDVETTGFSPRYDCLVEAACVLVDDSCVVATWSSLINPGREIPRYATAVHGIRNEDVAGAPGREVVCNTLRWLCSGATVVAHNAAFDLAFLPELARLPSLCTVRLARRCFPNAPNYKNQTLRAYLGLDGNPLVRRARAHRALDDALVTAAILVRCLERLQAPRGISA